MNERTRDPHLVDDAHALPHGVVGARRNHGDEEGKHVRHGVGLARDAVVSIRRPGQLAMSSPVKSSYYYQWDTEKYKY
jgi:hypothetical protein